MERLTSWLTFKKAVFIILFLGFIVYASNLFNGFVWDDEEQIVNNTIIQNLYNWPQIFSGATFSTGGAGLSGWFFRPFLTLFYMLNFAVWKSNPFGFHLVQVIFHILNSLLLFLILQKLFRKGNKVTSLWIATITSAIFAVHPVFVEAVSYIASVHYVMLTFFNLLAIYMMLKLKKVGLKQLIIISSLIFSGLLFNESSIVAVPILISYILIWKDSNWEKWLASLSLTTALYFFIRLVVTKTPIRHPEFSQISEANLFTRLITIPKELFSYLKILVFPKDLAISQHFIVTSPKSPDFFIPLTILVIAFSVLIFAAIKLKSKLIIFGLIWFIFGFGLISNIFPLDMTIAERWIYFPSIGLFIVLSALLAHLPETRKLKMVILIVLAIFLSALSVRTIIRNSNWYDGYSLYSHDINISKNSFDLENNLGVELFRRGDFKNAKVHFEKSIALQPKWYFAYNNLGAVYEHEGDYQRAKNLYFQTLKYGDYYLAYENIAGILLYRENNPQSAKEFCQESLKKLPNNSKLWLILALSQYKLGNQKEALEAAKNAYSLLQDNETAYVYYQLSNNLPIEFK